MWFHSQVSLDAGYLSCLENPTDVCSIVSDAKEDILAIAIKRLPGICIYKSIQVLSSCAHTQLLLNMGYMQEWKINTGSISNYSDTSHAESEEYDTDYYCMIILFNYRKKQAYMDVYSECDTLSLQILFVYFLVLPSLLHPSIFYNIMQDTMSQIV